MIDLTSKSHSDKELKAELESLSKASPAKWFTFRSSFGSITIQQHDHTPGINYGESCYRFAGGFYKNGQIVKPSAAWLRQYNYVPCGDR